MLPNCTFIHAADLHLGAPFRGLGNNLSAQSGLRPEQASQLPFEALSRLQQLCLEKQPDFLILAGDVYDAQDGVLRAHLALRDMFLALDQAGIRVFLAHGNHDPLGGCIPVRWPDNVTVFGSEWESHVVLRHGEPVAVVDGISHTGKGVTENLAARYVAGEGHTLPRIAVLHCAVGSASDGHAAYAPCTLGDLSRHPVDYWALGHVHGHAVLATDPYIVYPGSLQGMHINEPGEHGCSLVTAKAGGCEHRFVPLAPAVWTTVRADLDRETCETVDNLETLLADHLESAAPPASEDHGVRHYLCRLLVTGRSPLDAVLRAPGTGRELSDRLHELLRERGLDQICLKDVRIKTSPPATGDRLAGLAGEVVRQADDLLQDESALLEFCRECLADLHDHRQIRRIAPLPQAEDLRELAAEARELAILMLEGS